MGFEGTELYLNSITWKMNWLFNWDNDISAGVLVSGVCRNPELLVALAHVQQRATFGLLFY